MGGAFVGLADDASAIGVNPAGLSLARYNFDLTSGENRIVNRETYFGNDTSTRKGLPYTSQFRALALRLGSIGLGAGYGVPYALDYDNGGTTVSKQVIRIESYDLAAAWSPFRFLALGVTMHAESAKVAFVNNDQSTLESKKSMNYATYGLLLKVDRTASLGLSFSPERRYDIDESLDAKMVPSPTTTTTETEWFHDVVIPAKFSLGMSVQSNSRLRWVGDVDIFQRVTDTIVVGGSWQDPSTRILDEQQSVIHGGFEFFVQKSKDFDFIWRGGGYGEPKRMLNSSDRFHFTMGIETRFYFVVFSAAYDQAPGFSNVAQSVSVSLGEI